MPQYRTIEQTFTGQQTSDGAGVKLTRILTQDLQQRLDPFLMLDVFGSDKPDEYIAGFPEHPHRGFETVTYMLNGRMRHQDSRGNHGVLEPGGVQWMTAGRGILHSEMPEQQDGLLEGFQLWINLPAARKMVEPLYQDLLSEQLPEKQFVDGSMVRAIAGEFEVQSGTASRERLTGAIKRPDTQPIFADIHLEADSSLTLFLPVNHCAFVYTYRGLIEIAGQSLPSGEMAVLSQNDDEADRVSLSAADASRAILIAGAALHEPIAQYGPFVMNTHDELIQAVEDFQAGRLGRD
ncbi:MAG: pirin family protein [Burkholderiaceae bacterium]